MLQHIVFIYTTVSIEEHNCVIDIRICLCHSAFDRGFTELSFKSRLFLSVTENVDELIDLLFIFGHSKILYLLFLLDLALQ